MQLDEGAMPGSTASSPVSPGRFLPAAPDRVLPPEAALPLDALPLDPSTEVIDAAEIAAWIDGVKASMAEQQDDPWAVIDACMEADMLGDPDDPGDDTPGAAIAIATEDQLAYFKGYGVKDLELGGQIDEETMFRIGSTTKMQTAAAVMQLSEQDLVALDEPISTYLSDFGLAEPWDSYTLTLHNLMTHSSGLLDGYRISDPNTSLQDWVPVLKNEPLFAPPGSFWNYANPNFSLAGAIVESVSQQPFAQYMQEQIYEPAGMPLTTVDATEVISHGNYAVGQNGSQQIRPGDVDYPVAVPAGYAWSTPREMVRWALVLGTDSEGVLSPESAFEMQEPQVSLDMQPWVHYGYGIFVTDYRDTEDEEQIVTVYDHGGNTVGYSSQLYWVPERGFVVSILANTMRSLSRAAQCALGEVAGVERIPTTDLGTGPDVWKDYVGMYSMLDVALWPFTANVTLEDDQVMMDFVDVSGDLLVLGDKFSLQNAFLDVFVANAQPFLLPSRMDITFIRDRQDESIVRYARNRNLVGERVGDVPPRVSVEGEGCTEVAITAGRDFDQLDVMASGVTTPISVRDAKIFQDDPNDPSSASYKLDIEAEAQLTLFYAMLEGKQTDSLRSYLMYDANADGEFDFPSEAVAGGVGKPSFQLIYATRPMPAGHYQMWVLGYSVPGGESTIDIEAMAIDGEGLYLENAPTTLEEGQDWTMKVCAGPVDEGIDGPALGTILYRYGWPPRLFRTMVDWIPEGGVPTPTPTATPGATPVPPGLVNFLPLSLRGSGGQ